MGSIDGTSLSTRTKLPWENSQQTQPAWNQPTAIPNAYSNMQNVADQMMSGAAFDPYRTAMQEASAASQRQQRSQVGATLQSRGLAGTGFADQMARSSERALGQDRMKAELDAHMGEQSMKVEGAGLGLNIQQQREQAINNQMSADIAREELSSRERVANAELSSRSSIADADRKLQEKLGLGDLDLRDKSLKLQEILTNRELDIKERTELFNEELGRGDLDLRQKTQLFNEFVGRGELSLKEGQLDLSRLQVENDQTYRTQQLALQDKFGTEELKIRAQEGSALEKFRQMTLELDRLRLDSDTKYKAEQLQLQYKELDLRDKQIIGQLDLGNKELDARDRQFLQTLGLNKQTQDWLAEYQKQQIKLQNTIAGQDFDLKSRQLDLEEYDPQRKVNEAGSDRIIDSMNSQIFDPKYGWYTPA